MATTQVMISPEALKASQHSERSPDPCIVVIFGASGDLTKRKLLPAQMCIRDRSIPAPPCA